MKAINLAVYVPRQLKLKLHSANLLAAAVKEASARVLERLVGSEELEDAAKAASFAAVYLRATELNRDHEGGRGLTVYGNRLLTDGSQHFEDVVDASVRFAGFEGGRRRIARFQNEQLNTSRLAQEADRIIHEVQARLDHDFTNIRERQHVINILLQEVSRLQTEIGQASAANSQELVVLERERGNRRQSRSTPVNTPAGWFQRIKSKLAQLAGRFEERLTNDEGSDILRRIEEEILHLQIRSLVLAAEEQTVGEVLRKLNEESERGERSSTLLSAEAQAMRESARQAELSRGWNVAAGELCLNSIELTEAAVASMDANNLWAQFTEMYRARREHDIFIITGGDFNSQDIEEIEEIVREIVNSRLKWNVVDCLAACEQANPNYVLTVLEAVRQATARDFLAIGYEGFLQHNTFAVISYAPGHTPQANQAFDRLLDDLTRVMGVEVSQVPDPYDQETLTIYIEDRAIPATALRVYDEDLYEAHDVRRTPSLTPHPEIHGIAKQTFPQVTNP
jgi:hypothetical protein